MHKFDKKIEDKLKLGKADLHIHTNYSDARPSVEEIIEYVESKTNLDVIAITDHDTIDGAVKAKEIVESRKKYRFQVIIGEEISTKEGHVIGLYLKEAIRPGQTASKTIHEIRKQNGIVLMPHPLRHIRFNTGKKNVDGVGFMVLLKEKANIDAIETINATPTLQKDNLKAMFFNDTLLFKAATGGSDAHISEAIGMGYTIFEGRTAEELKDAIKKGQTRPQDLRWGVLGLINYAFFFLPQGLRLFVNTLLHGRRPKQIQIINFPKAMLDKYRKPHS